MLSTGEGGLYGCGCVWVWVGVWVGVCVGGCGCVGVGMGGCGCVSVVLIVIHDCTFPPM